MAIKRLIPFGWCLPGHKKFQWVLASEEMAGEGQAVEDLLPFGVGEAGGVVLNPAQELLDALYLCPLLDDLSQMVAAFLDGLLDTSLVFLPAAPFLGGFPFAAGDFGLPVCFLQLGDEVTPIDERRPLTLQLTQYCTKLGGLCFLEALADRPERARHPADRSKTAFCISRNLKPPRQHLPTMWCLICTSRFPAPRSPTSCWR